MMNNSIKGKANPAVLNCVGNCNECSIHNECNKKCVNCICGVYCAYSKGIAYKVDKESKCLCMYCVEECICYECDLDGVCNKKCTKH